MLEKRMTINQTLVLTKAVRERVNELRSLRTETAKIERWLGNDHNKVIEPQYDVKKVDQKITELERFLFRAESKIKSSNAVTAIDIEADVDQLLSSIQ